MLQLHLKHETYHYRLEVCLRTLVMSVAKCRGSWVVGKRSWVVGVGKCRG